MKVSLYLETSVIGAYLDNTDTSRRDLTIRWWEHELSEYEPYVSSLVTGELGRTPEPHRTGYLGLISGLKTLAIPEEAAILAEGYIDRGIFPRTSLAAALHVAVAAFHKVDYLVTWEFGTIANVRKQARLRVFHQAAGFHSPSIVTPEFLVHAE
ncbi:MAG: hypothetical protein KF736_05515 [Acidobacteria bacterium]|nr:hypothetical protein [Acidobacteriota bacterium]MCW5948602.1 hypothetical protein [Pyrinomonadaceae bacterium]